MYVEGGAGGSDSTMSSKEVIGNPGKLKLELGVDVEGCEGDNDSMELGTSKL